MKNITKFFVLFLCCALLVFAVVRPVQVNAAAAAATITIGTAAGASASVVLPIAIIAVILAGLGYLVDNFDELVRTATEIYNTASTSVKRWLDDAATKIQNGIQRITIYEPARIHIIEYINNNPSPNGWDKGKIVLLTFALLFIFPKVLSAIDRLTPEDVFGDEVVEAIEETNSILVQIKGALGSLRNTIETSYYNLGLSLDSVATNISAMKNAVVEWTGNVNDTVATFGSSLLSWIGDLNANVVFYGQKNVEWLGNVNLSLGNVIDTIKNSLTLTSQHIVGELGSVQNSISDLNADQLEWLGNVNSSLGTVGNRVTNSVATLSQHIVPYIENSLGFEEGSQQILDSINNKFADVSTSLEVDFDSLQSTVGEVGSALELDLGSIKTTFDNVGSELETSLNTINTGVQTWGTNIQTWTQNVNSNVVTYGKSTVDWLKNVNSNLVSSTNALGIRIETALNPSVDKPDTGPADQVEKQEKDIIVGIGSGLGNTQMYMDDANSILNANLTNFLAAGLIFNVFADIPFFQQLLIISVSIGLVGSLLGIALSAAGRQGSDARKKDFSRGGNVRGTTS